MEQDTLIWKYPCNECNHWVDGNLWVCRRGASPWTAMEKQYCSKQNLPFPDEQGYDEAVKKMMKRHSKILKKRNNNKIS